MNCFITKNLNIIFFLLVVRFVSLIYVHIISISINFFPYQPDIFFLVMYHNKLVIFVLIWKVNGYIQVVISLFIKKHLLLNPIVKLVILSSVSTFDSLSYLHLQVILTFHLYLFFLFHFMSYPTHLRPLVFFLISILLPCLHSHLSHLVQ